MPFTLSFYYFVFISFNKNIIDREDFVLLLCLRVLFSDESEPVKLLAADSLPMS